ncbi:D-alanyl-D-alanine carboxypeptidase/D-alanyl-D-alanine-endopeptidase [Aestuariibius sp. 2305UL40-4]|uniref:D-alanyl-D-alanine carboxypeptidase/D-alanyl-D-alanine endopeptidase n=1 Tax=Aestuariibius violaceus TaxID=3234132 RepID=UPI00345E3045
MTGYFRSDWTRRGLLGGLAGAAAGAAWAEAPLRSLRPVARDPRLAEQAALARPRARRESQALVDQAGLSGVVAFAVADARTGRILEALEEDQPLPPASALKAVTAAYALERLGPSYRFRTEVIGTGPVREGVLDGDLALIGGGDPVMNTDHLGLFAEALKDRGIRRVTGDLVIWAGALPYVAMIDPSQPVYVGYSPSVSGLNLNFNRVHFQWQRNGTDYDITMDARTERYRPEVAMSRMQIVDRRTPVYTYEDREGADLWTVRRGALGASGSRWLPVRKPVLYAGEVFRVLLRGQGITIGGTIAEAAERPEGPVLAERTSPALRVILRDMLRYSTNLTAEVVGMTATAAAGSIPADLRQSGREMARWAAARYGVGSRFVDHSGLGDGSALSAVEMVRILNGSGADGALRPILRTIPMRDANRNIIQGHPVAVQAKTGTLNFVSTLAGFCDAVDGRDLTFAIFTADMGRRAGLSRAERERPEGGQSWARRSRNLQQRLLQRWGVVHAT